jgi:hypothetical protein
VGEELEVEPVNHLILEVIIILASLGTQTTLSIQVNYSIKLQVNRYKLQLALGHSQQATHLLIEMRIKWKSTKKS